MSHKIILMIASLLLFSNFKVDLYADHEHSKDRLVFIQNQINVIFQNQLVKELDLKGSKKEKVLGILKKNDEKKAFYINELLHVRNELSQLEKKKNTDVKEFSRIIQKTKELQFEIQKCENANLSDLKSVLTEEEMAKYIVLRHQLTKKLKSSVREKLKDADNAHKYKPLY